MHIMNIIQVLLEEFKRKKCSLLGGRLRMGISERYTTKRDEKAPKKVEGTLHDYRGAPGGTLL